MNIMKSFSIFRNDGSARGRSHRTLLLLLLLSTVIMFTTNVHGYPCVDKHCECVSVSGKLTATCASNTNYGPKMLPTCEKVDRAERDRRELIQVLNLTNSGNFGTLEARTFADACLLNLQKIWMPYVGLHHVDDEAFHKLSNVVELSMSHNSLTALPTRALEQLTRLRVLDLSHNHIKMIGHEAFRNNPALETITLNNNDIHIIEVNAFNNLNSLRILNLAANRLTTLEADVLKPVLRLHSLYLEGNDWNCDCKMQPFKRQLLLRNLVTVLDQPRCKATGSVWSNLALDNFQCAPKIYRNFSDNEVTTAEGSTLRLKCAVMIETFGDQAADEEYLSYTQLSWYWNDVLITNNSKGCDEACNGYTTSEKGTSQHFEVHDAIREFSKDLKLKISTLTLHSIMTQNEGSYRCEASNTAGTEENNYHVHIISYGNNNNNLNANDYGNNIQPEASRSNPYGVYKKVSSGESTSNEGSDHILFGLVLGILSGIFIVLVIFSIVLVVFFRRNKAHPVQGEPPTEMIVGDHQEMTMVGDSSSTIDDNHETGTEKLNVSQIEFNPLLTQVVNPVAKPPRLGIPDVSSIYSSPAWTMERANRSRYASYAETEPLYSDYYTLYRNRRLNSRLDNRTFISDTASEV